MNRKHIINLIVGPALMIFCALFLPANVFVETSSRVAIGTILWMSYWWITAPIDYAVTAFLPIAINSLIKMAEMKSVIANYSSETILLLLGASILAVSWEKTGLDKRIAINLLKLIGPSLKTQIIFMFLISTLLSSVLPNSVVCATMTPIAVAMLNYIGETDVAKSKIASKLLLTIAYGAGVGGLASPLGGAMNLVVVEYIEKITGSEYMYYEWVIKFLPIMAVLIISNTLFMIRDVKKTENLGGSREYYAEQLKNMPQMAIEEKFSFVLFVIAVILSFTRQLYQSLLPGLKPAYLFIICAILSFLISNKDGERVMLWKSVQVKIIWDLIFVFAGGLAAGTIINDSGAAAAIGSLVAGLNLSGGIVSVFVIIIFTLLMSDILSNTATAAVALPIIIPITQSAGLDPLPYIYAATVGINLSYMLPTSIRAIPVGYGLQPKYMLKEGYKITIIVIISMTICCYLLFII